MRVMVIGASRDRNKYGNRALRTYIELGHDVVAINPKAGEIEGVRAYANVLDPSGPIDRAIVYLPPEIGIEVVRELAQRNDVGELWISPGAESDELIEEAKRLGFDPIQACAIVDATRG
ncbi:MAG: CoA-binding protein [Planctomycetes bacterium]|nr:CoA-binding protein [Planctomycetota bacterium]